MTTSQDLGWVFASYILYMGAFAIRITHSNPKPVPLWSVQARTLLRIKSILNEWFQTWQSSVFPSSANVYSETVFEIYFVSGWKIIPRKMGMALCIRPQWHIIFPWNQQKDYPILSVASINQCHCLMLYRRISLFFSFRGPFVIMWDWTNLFQKAILKTFLLILSSEIWVTYSIMW